MRLVQFFLPQTGLRVGLVRDEEVIDVTSEDGPTVLDLLECAADSGRDINDYLGELQPNDAQTLKFADLDVAPAGDKPHLMVPISPPEVWGCGVTYERSAKTRDDDAEEDIYGRVYASERPEIFFKATPSRCVGPNGGIGIRSDSALTATEPELAYVLGHDQNLIGYTICNDVSAWDLERENPLYLPQSKTFQGCCALGPTFATPREVGDPMNLNIRCAIIRGEQTLFEGRVNSSKINRSFAQLSEYLCRHNPVPFGTVVSTGTGIMVPNEFALKDGDLVEIEIEKIGTLRNVARQL